MRNFVLKIINKLYFKKWVIGICNDDIERLIRNRNFEFKITWLLKDSFNKFCADPFPLTVENGAFQILIEEFRFEEDYGKISLMKIDPTMSNIQCKTLLDTKSHLSYPYYFKENNKIYVFPESAQNGKLSCYIYCPKEESMVFHKDILDIPLRDSTIIKYNGKYWIFGATSDKFTNYRLEIFFSDNLLGPYQVHPSSGFKSGMDQIRPAGKIIEVDGVLYRPTQNCKNRYGESITINKIIELNESTFNEEPYLYININSKKLHNKGMHSIHTINPIDNYIVVDGEHWQFSPLRQLNKYLKSKKNKL